MKKKINVSTSDFAKIIRDDNLFIDKSLFIKNILEEATDAILITRPRRWGKTVNLSMLQYFLDMNNHSDTKKLFSHLHIAHVDNGKYMASQGQFPVISISFKDAQETSFEGFINNMTLLMQETFDQHSFLLRSDKLSAPEISLFEKYLAGMANQQELEQSLKILTKLLHKHLEKSVYILIDGHETPLYHAFIENLQNNSIDTQNLVSKTTDFMRNFYSITCKNNPFLEKTILTGITCFAQDSSLIYPNNLKIYTLLDNYFKDDFGFTGDEIDWLSECYELGEYKKTIHKWYGGYQISDAALSIPWSVVNYIHDRPKEAPPYWMNSSDDSQIIKTLLIQANDEFKNELKQMLTGNAISTAITEFVRHDNLANSSTSIWSLLTATGYIKCAAKKRELNHYHAHLDIPNQEIYSFYIETYKEWMQTMFTETLNDNFIHDLTSGNIASFSKTLVQFLQRVNYRDLVLGLIANLYPTYESYSSHKNPNNLDVMLIPKDNAYHTAFILEFDQADRAKDIKPLSIKTCENAEIQHYQIHLSHRNYVRQIVKIGVGFFENTIAVAHCMVDVENNPLSKVIVES